MSRVSSSIPPGTPPTIDVEFVEVPALLPDPAAGTGALVARGVTAPVSVLVNRQELVRAKDRERKRRHRALERSARQNRERRRRVLRRILPVGVAGLLVAGLLAVPAVSGGVPAGRLDQLLLQQIGLAGRIDGVSGKVEGVADLLGGVAAQVAALPDAARRLDGVAAAAAIIEQRLGLVDRRLGARPAQSDEVSRGTTTVLAAVAALGERFGEVDQKLDALNTLVAAAPTRLGPAAGAGPTAPGALPAAPGAAGAWPDLESCRDSAPVTATWRARRGEWLSETINRWARDACWQPPEWRVPGDYPWRADAIFSDRTFTEAVRGALRAFEQAVPRPLGEATIENRALTIYPAADDRGG